MIRVNGVGCVRALVVLAVAVAANAIAACSSKNNSNGTNTNGGVAGLLGSMQTPSTTSAGSGGTSGVGGSGGTSGTGGTVDAGSARDGGAGGTVDAGSARDGGAGAPGADGGGACDCGSFAGYRTCCGDRCLNLHNDPLNCGACGNHCPADKPFCESGTCQKPPCQGQGQSCSAGTCCGSSCCGANQICCSLEGPLSGIAGCYTPTPDQPSCPQGCAPLCISDRNLKTALEPVDPQEVLARLGGLPISRWSYRSEPRTVRHMGPMAQDFKAAFGLGDTDRGYYTVDANGVAFAAIQALKVVSEEQQRQIERLVRDKRALEQRLRRLEDSINRRQRRASAPPRAP